MIERFDSMIGQTMSTVVNMDNEALVFVVDGVARFVFDHAQDCCECVRIEDIVGDLANLVGSPILEAEQIDSEPEPYAGGESYTWTFYRFSTVKGTVTVRWLGESNGYYSEGVDYKEIWWK